MNEEERMRWKKWSKRRRRIRRRSANFPPSKRAGYNVHTIQIISYFTRKKGNAKHMYPHESICIHITHVVGLFSSWAHSNHLAAEAAAVGEIPHCALHSKVRTNFAHTHMPYECHTICLYFIIDPLRGYQMYKLQTYKPKPYKDAA